MSGKDVLRLLLISYGFCRNIEISTYNCNLMCVYYNSRKDCALIFTSVNLQHGLPKQK